MSTLNIKEVLARKAREKEAAELMDMPMTGVMGGGLRTKPATELMSVDDLMNTPMRDTAIPITLVELEEGEIDPRLKLLSHSSRTTLHKCPRKYQLYRLSSNRIAMSEQKEAEQSLTFAYGTIVGLGLQSCMEGKSENAIYLECFLEWEADLLFENERQNKSFWLAMFAVKKFIQLRERGFLADYELVEYLGKPAVELSFEIILPNGFRYRGFVDAVLKHKVTGEIMVLEAKTSSGTANSSMYKNSGQALGYSVVLDILFPDVSAYEVLYLVYESKSYNYVELPFKKSLLQRALWLQELIIDCQMIELYDAYGTYPMHGESCFDFFRDCEYLGNCTLSTEHIAKPLTTAIVDKVAKDSDNYQFSVTFEELVESQISKGH